jgi:hypothetical protein
MEILIRRHMRDEITHEAFLRLAKEFALTQI